VLHDQLSYLTETSAPTAIAIAINIGLAIAENV